MKNRVSKQIVHIARDDIFIDTAYDIYEKAFPNRNKFLILKNKQTNIKYLSSKKEYYFVEPIDDYITIVDSLINDASLIVFHGVDSYQAKIALKLKKNKKKYLWSVFGGEVYNNKKIFKNESIGKKTHKKYGFNIKKWIKDFIRPYFYLLTKAQYEPSKVIKDSLATMDFAGILYKEELDNFRCLEIVKPDIEHIKFTYYPLNLIIEESSGFVNNDNILLGNSASYTNNHLEAFEILEKFDLGRHKIISSLSYGNHEYAKQIIDLGFRKFGENFQPLTDFLPLSDYQKILHSCGIVIMYHYRQQAIGNIMNAIYLGAKVYLSNTNTLYHYLKRIGCHVFCIEEDLIPSNQTVFEMLDKKRMLENRELLKEELSLDRVVNELKNKLTPLLF